MIHRAILLLLMTVSLRLFLQVRLVRQRDDLIIMVAKQH